MTKVWIVLESAHDETIVMYVCATFEKALELQEKHQTDPKRKYSEYYIDEYEVIQ